VGRSFSKKENCGLGTSSADLLMLLRTASTSLAKQETAIMSKSKAKPAAKSVPKAKSKQEEVAAPASEATTPAAEPMVATVETPVAAPEAPAAKEAVIAVEQNSIKRPAAETLCGRVWKALDDLRATGVDATAKNAAPAFEGVAIAAATIRTQTQRWRKFNGIA